jgi:CTP synthase
MEIGIQPDFLICRSEKPLQDDVKRKIGLFCNVDFGAVIESPDVQTIYQIPLVFEQQGFADRVMERLRLTAPTPDLSAWRAMVQRITHPTDKVRICVVGKYTDYVDSYKSVQEALIHGGIANNVGVELAWTSSDLFTSAEAARDILSSFHGLLVPGGFGVRGVEGMIEAIRAARELEIPFFGICLGMQVAMIDFARHVLGMDDSHSSEFAPECRDPVVSLMDSQREVTDKGGTMRLGAYPCLLQAGSKAAAVYGTSEVSERHRHRYEVSNRYRERFIERGMRLSGLSPDDTLVEMIELPSHPYFVACQFHPELQSRPLRPHPLFAGFVKAAHDRQAGSR